MLIYPAVDLQAGRCVRLYKGRFDEATVYGDDPQAQLRAFAEAGATWAHVVDLDGAQAGRPVQHDLIGRLAADAGLRLQAGGGVRDRAAVAALLDAGAARVVVGSAAVQRPDEVRAWLAEFGPERLCLAFDVRLENGEPEVVVRGWTEGSGLTLAAALALYPEGTLRHVLITDVNRDGALEGPAATLIEASSTARPDLRVQASGGVASTADLDALRATGAAGVIVGRALYEGRFTLKEALRGR